MLLKLFTMNQSSQKTKSATTKRATDIKGIKFMEKKDHPLTQDDFMKILSLACW